MGRKPQPKKGKLQVLNLRTTTELREKLEAAAKANGRSLSAEVEERLLISFYSRDELFGDQPTRRLMVMMPTAISTAERMYERNWRDDPFVRREIQEMCSLIIEMLSNPEKPKLDESSDSEAVG